MSLHENPDPDRTWRRTAACAVAIAVLAGCERTPQPAPQQPVLRALAPAETVAQMHALRVAGRYRELGELVAAEHREDVLQLVGAVDELIAAEGRLQRILRERLGEGSATAFRQRRRVANILGPLSRDVEVIDETIDQTDAEVSVQVAGRLPLERVNLVQREGVWYVLSDTPIPGLAEEIRALAGATRQVAGDVQRRPLSPKEVDALLTLRQRPALERIAALTAAAEADAP